MPDPKQNAQAFGASLEKSGFKVTLHSREPWRPDYLGDVQSGQAALYLLGWTGDFGDPANFLNVHFGAVQRRSSGSTTRRCSRCCRRPTRRRTSRSARRCTSRPASTS